METTFITIHDLSPEARILYTSDSIVDILGYSPDEVVNRPCWDFFHHEELPFARAKHGKGVEMDKAAVLSYCRLRDKDGRWLGCEVVFTVVFDVMVGCTSIYRRGLKSQSRATEAPVIRRLFSSSPRDPRYHMLSHLSSKFELPPIHGNHEPRAALFLNRYTRTLTIMYATDGLSDVLGISGEEMKGKSFYYCIEENCLQDAVRCLENAKANDSIAYLRFWYRDPRQPDLGHGRSAGLPDQQEPDDQEMEDMVSDNEGSASGEDMVDYHSQSPQDDRNRETSHETIESGAVSSSGSIEPVERRGGPDGLRAPVAHEDSRASSGRSSNPFSHEAVFGEPDHNGSSASSMSNSPTEMQSSFRGRWRNNRPQGPIELEAVVSCTSDGLVVCLRRARPAVPQDTKQPSGSVEPVYANGFFAAPWGTEPHLPPPPDRPQYTQPPEGARPLAPGATHLSPISPHTRSGPDNFMNAIRDIVVFAWALTGINGSLAEYGHGKPRGEAQPASGLPIWQPGPPLEDPLIDGVKHIDGHPSDKTNSGIRETVEAITSHDTLPGKGQQHEMRNSNGQLVDGIDGHGASMDCDGAGSAGPEMKSQSPVTNYSYHLGKGHIGQTQSPYGSDSTSSLSGQTPNGHTSALSPTDGWQKPSVMHGIMTDRSSRLSDGLENHADRRSNSSHGYSRIVNGDPYGFGDPGLSSKNVFRPYGSTTSPMHPHGVSEQNGSSAGSPDGHK